MALESLPKIAPALFSAEQDLLEIYNKKTDTRGTINPSYIKSSPSGVSGAIQFSDGSAFASDAANLFWDNTNKRLGVGTNALGNSFLTSEISTAGAVTLNDKVNLYLSSNITSAGIKFSASNGGSWIQSTQASGGTNPYRLQLNPFGESVNVGTASNLGASLGIKGSGSTSATTSLLVQNSAGSTALSIKDDLSVIFNGTTTFNNDFLATGPNQVKLYGYSYLDIQNGISGTRILIQSTTVRLNNKMIVGTVASDAVASAQFQIDSTTTGFLPPRMTTAQVNAIASPAVGLMAYNTDLDCPVFYSSAGWRKISHSAM